MHERLKVIGEWDIRLISAETGELLHQVLKSNVVTNVGKELFSTAMVEGLGESKHYWEYGEKHEGTQPLRYVRYPWSLMLGTGAGTPSATDTNLFSAKSVSEKRWLAWGYGVGSLTRVDSTLTYYQKYEPEDANGYTYIEAGIYDGQNQSGGYATGTMINHVTFGGITKDVTKFLEVYVNLTFVG